MPFSSVKIADILNYIRGDIGRAGKGEREEERDRKRDRKGEIERKKYDLGRYIRCLLWKGDITR
jgi:hypothetical protein